MLLTHKHAELLVPSERNVHTQYWQYVEQSTVWPWFYVELVRAGRGGRVASMLMIPNVPVLEQVLKAVNSDNWLSQVLVVTPSDVNGSRRWQMEPLIELSVAKNREGKALGYIFQVEDARVYTSFTPLSSSEQVSSQLIFSAAKHLR